MNIIFDLDGTLFQIKYCVINAVNRLFDELKIDRVSEEEITSNIGKVTNDFLQYILPKQVNVNDVFKRYRELEQEEIQKQGLLFPNIKKILNDLMRKGHKLFICSAGSMDYIKQVLIKTEISDYFNQVYCTKINKNKAHIISEIISSDLRAVVIVDTQTDIDAARINSLPSIAYICGYGFTNANSNATINANNVEDITGIVSQIDIFYHIRDSLIFKGLVLMV